MPGSGLGSALGIAPEATVGTAVAPSRWLEYNTESLSLEKNITQGGGLRSAGLYARSGRRAYTTRTVGGDLELDVATKGMGLLFRQMLGGAITPTLVSGTAYQHVYSPADTQGRSLSVQKLVPQTDGVVKAFTYNGCKVKEWEMSCAVGEILQLKTSLDAWNESTAVAAGTPTYTAGTEIFHFAQGALRLGGTVSTTAGLTSVTGGTVVAAVTKASVKGANKFADSRFYIGSAGVKAEQLENDWREVGGSLDVEFVNQATVYDLFAADTPTALQLTFTGTTAISGAVFPTLEVTIPSIRFDGESPKVGGPDIVSLAADFTGLDDGVNNTVQIRWVTSDVTVS